MAPSAFTKYMTSAAAVVHAEMGEGTLFVAILVCSLCLACALFQDIAFLDAHTYVCIRRSTAEAAHCVLEFGGCSDDGCAQSTMEHQLNDVGVLGAEGLTYARRC